MFPFIILIDDDSCEVKVYVVVVGSLCYLLLSVQKVMHVYITPSLLLNKLQYDKYNATASPVHTQNAQPRPLILTTLHTICQVFIHNTSRIRLNLN